MLPVVIPGVMIRHPINEMYSPPKKLIRRFSELKLLLPFFKLTVPSLLVTWSKAVSTQLIYTVAPVT